MRYQSPAALRAAIEQRLLSQSQQTGISLDRLRRRVLYERIVIRLDLAEPATWVVKGGLALDVRMGERARTTKDLDLGLIEDAIEGDRIRERLIDALATDPDRDWFTFVVGRPRQLNADQQGRVIWRFSVESSLAGRPFGALKLDVAPRIGEHEPTERVLLHNLLEFADLKSRTVELIDINRHAAEKFHALTREYDDRPNSRVRDLIDLVLLLENDYLDATRCCDTIEATFTQRDTHSIPNELADPPPAWAAHYATLTEDLDVEAKSLDTAMQLVRSFWYQLLEAGE